MSASLSSPVAAPPGTCCRRWRSWTAWCWPAGHRRSLHYVGTRRGVESRLVPPTGYAHTLFDVVGLQRSLSRRNLAFVPKLISATWRARRLLRTLRPKVVVNVGGYASMPATLAARLCRVPLVVVSYDRRPGLASRLSARFAVATAAAFPDSPLPRAAPDRGPASAGDHRRRPTTRSRRRRARSLDVPADRFMVTVFGGSLGAKAINEAVAGLVEHWHDRTDVVVHHVVGDRWLADAPPARDGTAGIMYRVIGYEDRMPLLYAATDVMVTRGGASTIAELAATGTPAIIVPWPDAAENHQLDNARTLTDRGAAVLVEQHDLTTARLADQLDALIQRPEPADRHGRPCVGRGAAASR